MERRRKSAASTDSDTGDEELATKLAEMSADTSLSVEQSDGESRCIFVRENVAMLTILPSQSVCLFAERRPTTRSRVLANSGRKWSCETRPLHIEHGKSAGVARNSR
jgi:hypothetical protein